MKITAYKVFNPDWTCRGFQYEVGKTYKHEGGISICKKGFHACKKLTSCFEYYGFNPRNKIAKVKLHGETLNDGYGDLIVASKIKIVKEITWQEALDLINSGPQNTGRNNAGEQNTGNYNTGDHNSGSWNTGGWNSGSWNTGDWNTGSQNCGYGNHGDYNFGNWNIGNWNTGDQNAGNRSTGSQNHGNANTGNWNSGSWNSGNWNTSNFNTGHLNTKKREIINVFNKPLPLKTWEAAQIPNFFWFNTNPWTPDIEMTDEEKQQNPDYKLVGGYVKKLRYKEAWRESWDNTTSADRELVLDLPNFDNQVFKEISGIDVHKELGINDE